MSPMLLNVTTLCTAALLAAAAMCMYRLIAGPNVADRAVAFDCLSSVFIGLLCVICIAWESVLYFDAVWILTLIGFLGSAAIARYMERGKVF